MADEVLKRDQNFITVLGGITNDADEEIKMLRVDPITKRLLISATGIDFSVTLADVSTNSTTTPNSVYQMTSAIPVNYKSSDGNSILYIDETNERVGVNQATPLYPLHVKGVSASQAITSDASLGSELLSDQTGAVASGNGTFITKSVGVVSGETYYIFFNLASSVANNGVVEVKLGTVAQILTIGYLTNASDLPVAIKANTTGTVSLTFTVIRYTSGTLTVANTISVKQFIKSTPTFTSLTSSGTVGTEMRALGSIGLDAGRMTTSTSNLGIGNNAMANLYSSSSVTAIGYFALANGVGASSLDSTTAIGPFALNSLTYGFSNVAIGNSTAQNFLTGFSNTAIGTQAMLNKISGDNNTAIGNRALQGTSSTGSNYGDNNTAIGNRAGQGVSTGSGNTLIGYHLSSLSASINQVTTGSRNTSIGYAVAVPTATADDQLVIGNAIYGTSLTGTGTTVSTSALIGIGVKAPAAKLDILGITQTTSGTTGTYLSTQTSNATSGTLAQDSIVGTFASGAGSASYRPLSIAYTINNSGAQSGTATGIYLRATETALNGMGHNLIDLGTTAGGSKFSVTNAGTGSITNLSVATALTIGAGGYMNWSGRSLMASPSDGVIRLSNDAVSDFNRLQFGGTTSSFPSWQRSSTDLVARLADDSGNTNVTAAAFTATNANNGYIISGIGRIKSPSSGGGDGIFTMVNSAETSFNRLQFGGTTSSFPSLKRSTTGLIARLADDSASTFMEVSTLELGHATDTTLSRVSAGVIAVEGVTIPTISSTSVLTNKAITQRVVTTTDDATAVIDVAVTDQYELSAIANNTTFSFTGSPTDGQKFLIRYKDAGVSKTLTWTGFVAIGITLPAATTASKWGYVGVVYNSAASAYHAIATVTES